MEQAYNFLITRLYTTILVIVQNVKDLLLRQKKKRKKKEKNGKSMNIMVCVLYIAAEWHTGRHAVFLEK